MSENGQEPKPAGKKKHFENQANWRAKPRRRRLTPKQIAYVDHLLRTTSNTQAVIDAGYNVQSDNSAAQISSQNLRNTNVLSELVYRIKSGSYDKQIENIWQDCLNDEGNQSVKVSERMDTHRTKLKAVEQIAKIGGLIAPVKHETRTLTADITSLLPKGSIAK